MSIIAKREVKEVTIIVTRNGVERTLQPLLSVNGGDNNCDCDIDGGTP